MPMSLRQQRAQRRLMRDLQELADRSWELPTVSALPLEDNLFEWHCNIVGSGDHDGIVVHLKLLFPMTYPHQPPEVVLMSRFMHPNVFGDHLCLDMLEEGEWSDAKERDAEFTGWSSCYSVFSILMQLQAFLFDGVSDAHRSRRAAERCECFCGHGLHRVYPPLPTPLPPPPRPPVMQCPFKLDEELSTQAPSDEAMEEVQGIVSRVEPYGAFVRLDDGAVGLLHRSETPRGLRFEVGDKASCRVKAREPRLSLTMQRTEEELAVLAASGERIPATVSTVKPFGVFVDLGGFSGLLHRSEMDLMPGQWIPFAAGESVQVRLLGNVGPKLALSSRALHLRSVRARELMDGEVDLERLRCFHSKETFSEAVLGVGVSLEAEDAGNGQERHHLTSIYDVLAHGSFRDGVRKGVWKQKFRDFLPLALDAEHFKRAKPAIEESLARLSSGVIAEKTRSHGKSREDREAEYKARITLEEYKQTGLPAKPAPSSMVRPEGAPFSPEMVFEVLPKLMNSQVVLLSTGQLWRCQKALEGYFAYHHLLLHCLQAYPRLRTGMEAKLERFLADPEMRTKQRVPNLGEFLCYLSVSDKHGWRELGIPILEEAFDRNVLWILKQAPHLGDLSDCGASPARLKRSFNITKVSLRLIMFQVTFLQLVKAGGSASCSLERKDRSKGLPGPGEAEWLFQRCLEILEVEDYHEFLELIGATAMSEEELCRWLRHSMLRSISKGYHNPGLFAALAAKARASKEKQSAPEDPEDFGMDTRAKESKAEKRARKKAAMAARANLATQAAEYHKALSWARFHSPGGYEPRQTVLYLDEGEFAVLAPRIDGSGCLQQRYHSALKGYKLLDGMTLNKVKSFPARLWLGLGCRDCGKAVSCEMSGRCMPCCVKAAKEPAISRPVRGLTEPGAPVRTFTAFQAQAVTPVQWEMYFDVGFDGFVADLAPLRAVLSDDLVVTQPLQGSCVFSYVERAGKRLWEKSPEQVMYPGCRLTAGWQGVTDAVFTTKIRGLQFTLLQDTMHNMRTLEDLGRLKMCRTYCNDHVLKDKKTGEPIWDRPCKNCRGVLRLRFAAPDRYAERKAQLHSLNMEQLAQRASLNGVEASADRDATEKLILKCEGIVR